MTWMSVANDLDGVSRAVIKSLFNLKKNWISIWSCRNLLFDGNIYWELLTGVETEEAIQRGGQEVAEQLVNLAKPGTFDTKLNIVVPFNTE